jgi:hypothetical protein
MGTLFRVHLSTAALADFMENLRARLSAKVGRLVDWGGGFWERRYSAEPVLDTRCR